MKKFNRKTAANVMDSVMNQDQRESAKTIIKGKEREYVKKIHEQRRNHH